MDYKDDKDKENNYDKSPPKYFDIKNAKKLDIKSIESTEENLANNIKNIFR